MQHAHSNRVVGVISTLACAGMAVMHGGGKRLSEAIREWL